MAAGVGNHPSWAPDGRRIAAITVTEQGDLEICIIDVTTAAVTVITDGEADAFYPAWSPEGDLIVFARGPRKD